MPLRLVDRRLASSATDYRQQWREQRQWFLDGGINPGDWSQVYPIFWASWAAYGIPDASERGRRRLKIANPDLTRSLDR